MATLKPLPFFNKNMTPKTKETWDTLYRNGREYRALDMSLLPNLGAVGNQLALDIGCGKGASSFYIANRGYDTYAIDYSKEAITHAKRVHEHPNLHFIQRDINNFPIMSVDLLFFKLIIPFLSRNIVEKFIKALKPNGKLVIISPIGNDEIEIPKHHLTELTKGLKKVSSKEQAGLFYLIYKKI